MFEGLGNAVHLIAAVVWIGGLMFLVLGLRPALKRALPEEVARDAVQVPLYRRFWVLSAMAAVVLFFTGMMLMFSDPHYEGSPFALSTTWSWLLAGKHALFVAMAALLLASRKQREPKVERDLVDIALMLGVAVLVVTGLLTAIP